MSGHHHNSQKLARGARMLRTALGSAIARFLEDPAVVEVMLNPDGRIWVDRLSEGLADTGETMTAADGERIVRLVAHHVGAEVFQGLNDVGFALPPGAMTYWVGAAMEKTDLKDLGGIPASTDAAARAMVVNAVHLVRRLRDGGRFPDLA